MTLAVVVVTHNTRELTMECLEALERCAADLPRETLVVDNASTDGTAAAVAERFPHVELIVRPDNAGFSVGNNEALRRVPGRHTLLLNSDALLLPGALEAMLDLLEARPDAGLVACRLVDGEGRSQASAGGLPGLRMQAASWLGLRRLAPGARRVPALRRLVDAVFGAYFLPAEPGTEPRRVEFLSGACVLVRAEVWEQVGLFDERFFLYLEDADLCRRAAEAGWELYYLPGPAVVHLGGRSFAARSGGATYHLSLERARSVVYYFRKHGGAVQALAARSVIGAAVAPRLVVALVRGDRKRAGLLASILRVALARS